VRAAEDLLTPGEPVAVAISLPPTSITVYAGERLVVEVGGRPVGPGERPGVLPIVLPTRNGLHHVRTGGAYDSHLLLPVVP
jgi:uncharacterized protein